MDATAIATRATIDQIDGHRRRCLHLFGEAWDLVAQAYSHAAEAVPGGIYAMPELSVRNQLAPSTREAFIEQARRPLDKSIWQYLLRATSMDRLMDKAAKDEFRAQLEKDPPEATADNCRDVMEGLLADSGAIFRRGIANAFSGLDRRFRSHDGFKVGARIVLTWFAGADGFVRHDGKREVLVDVERTFAVLDGQPQPEPNGGIIGALALAKPPTFSAASYQAETDYFRVKVFKNGNAHVWFKRDDLVEKVNLMLAQHYGAVLGAGPDAADRTHEPNRTPAKNHGFFRSPPAVVSRLLELAGIQDRGGDWRGNLPRVLKVLEPNAGDGAVAGAAARFGHEVTAVEIQPHLADQLTGQGLFEIVRGDIFDQTPATIGQFDVVAMNPPFDGGRDIDHVVHAMRFLKPGGRLAAVMSAGTEFREDRKTADFRAMVERYGGTFRDLPAGSFAESGTMVNALICTLRTPEIE